MGYIERERFIVETIDRQPRMAISRTTRTHLIYQFIILTLLFLGIGYNELLPDRKFVLFLLFIPMFCYQLIILSCCMELLPVPSWMNVGETTSKKEETETTGKDSVSSSPVESSSKISPRTHVEKQVTDFSDLSDRIHGPRRWEKSVVNLGTSPKLSYPQKSKSWMNLSDSKKSGTEKLLSREGSLAALGPMCERKQSSYLSKDDRVNRREKRANKAKSWKSDCTAFDVPIDKNEVRRLIEVPTEERNTHTLLSSSVQHEEAELNKSYSFPFRQKRLHTWLELKDASTRESNGSLDMPYYQTVGYNLAVKYEARRRRRAVSSPTETDAACGIPPQTTNLQKSVEIPLQTLNLQKSIEISTGSTSPSKQSQKKNVKTASACINKIKMSFTNLLSKKKDEVSENVDTNSNKGLKPTVSFKSKNKTSQCKKENTAVVTEFPQFLSNDRPLIFYPKHIPFEKERFESDVQNKMLELAAEPKGLQRFGTR